MFTFSIVKKIDGEKCINKNNFIIERIKRERILSVQHTRLNSNKEKNSIFIRNEKFPTS